VATAGYTLVHLSVSRRLGDGGALWFLRLDNATDRLATSASSLQTVRGLSPLPGRSIKTGVRVAF
jgi:iron complex outermembrane recepter protein